jgi:hypothetical protein
MATIVTRAGKGEPLTHVEVDANFTNLNTDKAESSAVVAKTSATGAAAIPTGTEAQRDGTPSAGYFRFNTETTQFEGYNGTNWGSVGGGATGSSGDQVFVQNDQVVTADYTIPADKNAMTTGPIEINDGVTVTVSTGARWVVI